MAYGLSRASDGFRRPPIPSLELDYETVASLVRQLSPEDQARLRDLLPPPAPQAFAAPLDSLGGAPQAAPEPPAEEAHLYDTSWSALEDDSPPMGSGLAPHPAAEVEPEDPADDSGPHAALAALDDLGPDPTGYAEPAHDPLVALHDPAPTPYPEAPDEELGVDLAAGPDAGLEQILARTEVAQSDDDRLDEFERSIFEAAGRPPPSQEPPPPESDPQPAFGGGDDDPMATEVAEAGGDLDDMLASFLPGAGPVGETPPGPPPPTPTPELPPADLDDVFSAAALDLELSGEPVGQPVGEAVPPAYPPEDPAPTQPFDASAAFDSAFDGFDGMETVDGMEAAAPTPEPEPQAYQPEPAAYEAPAFEASAYEAPAYEAPADVAPAYEAPAYEAPAYEAPAYEAPGYEAVAHDEAAYEAAPMAAPLSAVDAALAGHVTPVEPAREEFSAVDAALAGHVTPPEPAREPVSAVDQAFAEHVPYDAPSAEPAAPVVSDPFGSDFEEMSPVEAALAQAAAEATSVPQPPEVSSAPQPAAEPEFDPLADYDPLAVLDEPESRPAATPAFEPDPVPEPMPRPASLFPDDPAPPPAPEGSPLAALDALGGAPARPEPLPPPPTGGDDLGALARRPSVPRPADAEEEMPTTIFVPSQQQAAAQHQAEEHAPVAAAEGPRASWEPDFYDLFQDARQQCEALADDQVLGELRRALTEVRKAGG